MSCLLINDWQRKDWIEENSLTEGNTSINESSVEYLNLVKERTEESRLTEEIYSEESTSTDENSIEDLNLVEEDQIEENSLTEEATSFTSTDESSVEDLNLVKERTEENRLTDESSVEDLNLVKERTEESRLTEEIYSEESTSTDENSIEDLNLVEEDRIEENSLTEEATSFTSTDESSIEDLNLEEIDLREDRTNYFSKEHGLVFRKMNCFETERNLIVQIVIIGNEDCGKTELIKTVFECHPSFTVLTHSTHIEYQVFLPGGHSHIWIYDAKGTEFVSKSKFAKKTVFLFCYDADNPQSFTNIEETWIPPILEKSMKEMFYLLVSIKREPKTEPKAKKLKKEDRQMAIKVKAKELNDRFGAGKIIECFIEDKQSLLNVFQSAIDYVYPRF